MAIAIATPKDSSASVATNVARPYMANHDLHCAPASLSLIYVVTIGTLVGIYNLSSLLGALVIPRGSYVTQWQ